MQLSQESYRTRWLVLVPLWTLITITLILQARAIRNYLAIVDQLALRGTAIAATPLKQPYPAFAADAQVWVRHSLSLIEGNSLRLRYTNIDNAPQGREVHWNSAWAWSIAGAGWVHHLFTGEPITYSIEKSTLWLNPLVLFLLTTAIASWATRQSGLIAGVVVTIAMISHERIYEGFFPSYVDHHGLLTVSVFGLTLGAVLMGGGWWEVHRTADFAVLPSSPEKARRGAVFSAISGACGMWVSAASTIPPIAIVGMAGVLAIVVNGRTARAAGATFDGNSWRMWGRIGSGLSFIFYLIEYFPNHLGLRLEPNHPFHAIAWLGAGELIAQFGERWLASSANRWRQPARLIWPMAAVSVTPLAILIGGTSVLSFTDKFMSRLHNDYIQEFLPIWMTMRGFNAKMIFQIFVVDSAPLLAAVATLTYRRRETPMVLWFATAVAALLTLMAWAQSRWLLNASGAQICLTLILIGCWTGSARPLHRWVATILVLAVLYVPTAVIRLYGATRDVANRVVAPRDAHAALNRDIAAALRASQPQGEITLLASPNASTAIGYYGRFKTIGTLYWENHTGLKSAAAMLGAKTEADAARLIKKHGVTHIAIISDENFIAEYHKLLFPTATIPEIKSCFGYRLFYEKVVPQWLQMIPYRIPDELKTLGSTVNLFKVNFNQNLVEAIYNVALTQISQEAYDDADRTLDMLLQQVPHLPQPWLRKAELLVARRKWTEATEHFLKGVSLAAEAERPALYVGAAGELYRHGQHALAIRLYRTALQSQRIPDIASYLAWVLATSTDDSLRNADEAIKLAEESLKADPNSPSYLSAYSAALAEARRFQDAITTAEQAFANAKLRGNLSLQMFLQRLEIVRAGKPLRN